MKKCTSCKNIKLPTEFHKNKSKKDGLSEECKICKRISASEYRLRNKDKVNKYQREYSKARKKTDPLYKMKRAIRERTSLAFKKSYWTKTSGNLNMLGAEYDIVFNHIQSQFTDGMNWSNHGKWHIDHIVPISSATTKEELESLCHYKNLQPLWAEDNLSKGDKIL